MDAANYTENIVDFVGLLRDEGLSLGVSEAGDAELILSSADMADRESVKLSLKSVLAKNPKEMRIFDRVFDGYFIGRGKQDKIEEDKREAAHAHSERIRSGRDELEHFGISDEIAEAYATASGERRTWLKNMLDYAEGGNRNLPLMKQYLSRIASGWLIDEAGYGMTAPTDEDDLLHKDLRTITEDEVPQALHMIEQFVRRIRITGELRRKRTGHRGMPDLRNTIHASLRTGGVPIKPIYKRRPKSARSIVVLCDISESMVMFSEFALRFITVFAQSSGKLRTWIFSEGSEEISLSDIGAFERTVRESELWRRGTDIGSAICSLLAQKPPVITKQTLLIVLSDAKTIDRPAAERALAEAASRAAQIIWLDPDRKPSAFAQQLAEADGVTHLSCYSLDLLARACARLS